MSKNGGNEMELGTAIDERSPDVTPVERQFRQRFERKFFVLPRNIDFAYGLLRHVCRQDSEYPSEQINSLYFDGPDLDQHDRSQSGDFRKDKVRIRWYCEDKNAPEMQTIFLEVKSKRAFASTKQRVRLQVPTENLTVRRLGDGVIPKSLLSDTLAKLGYFPLEPLQPIIKISYWRYRFSEVLTGQRVALDCRIRSTMVLPGSGNGEKELGLAGGVIEIKGPSVELPATLMRMRLLNIDWTRFSKYSACIDSHTEGLGSVGRVSPSGRIIQP
jgi:hypothetical protein